MTPAQRSAAMALVSSALSQSGFEKVQQIMEGDEMNKINEGNGPPFGRGPGRDRAEGHPRAEAADGHGNGGGNGRRAVTAAQMFGKDLYYISILGTPSEKNPWMLQFGGHHLALNITIAGERGILTPTLTGAQPALYTLNGKTVRPLGQESDKALALLNALDENQRKQAILNYRVADLVLGPGQDGKTIQPEGLKASAHERASARDAAGCDRGMGGYRSRERSGGPDGGAESRISTRPGLHGAARLPLTPGSNITAYYRIQGPHLVIEYAPQQLGGDPALHVHTMYRDPTNDYGRQACGEMNTRRLIVAAAILLLPGAPVSAHRLDEYLQATLISVEKDRVQAPMRLVPGVAVSSFVLSGHRYQCRRRDL